MTYCADTARRPDEQRLVDIASILAAGILRLRERQSLPVTPTTRILPIPLPNALSFPAKRSVWSTAVNEFTHEAESQHSRLSALKAVFFGGTAVLARLGQPNCFTFRERDKRLGWPA
jgi:hypothetical protein